MSRGASLVALPALVLATLTLAPFLHKAFTIDDPLFLLQAKHAVEDPLHPSAFDMVWDDAFDGGVPSRAASISGPLMAWLLVPTVLAGGDERIAHIVQLVFLAFALLATAALAKRIGISPVWSMAASVLVATAPGVLGMAGTAMPDVPAMALGVAGVERLLAWKQERRVHQAILATVLLVLATLARTHLSLLMVVGALLVAGDVNQFPTWRNVRWSSWVPLVVAPLLILGVVLITRDQHPNAGAVLGVPSQLRSPDRIPNNIVAFASHWALAFPLAIPWLLLRLRHLLRRWWVPVVAMAAAAAVLYQREPTQLLVAIAAGLSSAVLFDIFVDAWQRRDGVQLALGVWLLVPLAPVGYVHLPPKYLVAAAPSAALLVARMLARYGGRVPRVLLGTTAALGMALGVAILRADATFADIGRRAADELIAPMADAGHKVWFVGSWGFHWYAVEAGARPVTASPPYPSVGDLVVISQRSAPSAAALAVLARYPRATHVRLIEVRRPGGRVMSEEAGAGFYSNNVGFLPWGWGTDLLDRFDLWLLDTPSTSAR